MIKFFRKIWFSVQETEEEMGILLKNLEVAIRQSETILEEDG